ncbi:hypothetical protein DBT_1445 [Dissulfuribacter thermophilus]|uniref:Uncharacterized protein n=1 Tax=Dissulfuribacter thermophilus TaxID=1156395 RepID=A0A1B9F5X5_9BACT|nr:hypothetical protein DBT_1445 [Dissulfuribacter thermophilus]
MTSLDNSIENNCLCLSFIGDALGFMAKFARKWLHSVYFLAKNLTDF